MYLQILYYIFFNYPIISGFFFHIGFLFALRRETEGFLIQLHPQPRDALGQRKQGHNNDRLHDRDGYWHLLILLPQLINAVMR